MRSTMHNKLIPIRNQAVPHRSRQLLLQSRASIIGILLAMIALFGQIELVTAGPNSWTPIGPEGASVEQLLLDPHNTNTLYLLTGDSAGRRLFKSVSGSASWQALQLGLENETISAITISPTEPSTLFVATSRRTLQSKDGGATWERTHSGSPYDLETLSAATNLPNVLFATDWPRVYRSNDGGTSWETVGNLPTTDTPERYVIDPNDLQNQYLVMTNALYKSENGGQDWSLITTGLPDDARYRALTVDPTQSNVLYVGLQGKGIYKSTDTGKTWNPVNAGVTNSYINAVAVDSTDAQKVYAGTSGGLFQSTNGGATWSQLTNGLPTSSVFYTVAIVPDAPTTIYAGLIATGVYKSVDAGATWASSNAGLRNTYVSTLAFNPTTLTIYAGTTNQGVLRSADNGQSWTPSQTNISYAVSELAVNPANPTTLFAATYGGRFRSQDGGDTWVHLEPCFIFCFLPDVETIVIDPLEPNIVYAGIYATLFTSGGIRKSMDGGDTWQEVNNGLPANVSVSTLAIDPQSTNKLFAGTYSGLYASTDRGDTWVAAGTGWPSGYRVFAIAFDLNNSDNILAGSSVGLYQSTDGGERWAVVNIDGTNEAVTRVARHPIDPATIFIGRSDGVFRSINGGTTWSKVNAGLESTSIAALVFDPNHPDNLYAGTHGGGVHLLEHIVGPTIVEQPTSHTITFGRKATLTLQTAGSEANSYQWFVGNTGDTTMPIPGATAATFVTPPLTQSGAFWARATNARGGSSDSETAQITVVKEFTFVGNTEAIVGIPYLFSVHATSPENTIAQAYTGSVTITASDPAALLPETQTFTLDDHGALALEAVFNTLGVHTLQVTDTDNSTVQGQLTINVKLPTQEVYLPIILR